MPRKSLQAGYCGGSCSFEKEGCPDPTTFRSSREMQGSPDRAHGGSCRLQESIRETMLGYCTDANQENGDNICSPNAASCGYDDDDDDERFVTANEILEDKRDTNLNGGTSNHETCFVEDTHFGKCNDRCSWSPSDCVEDESWTFPAEECTCDKVQVGACEMDGNIFCAVSSNGCDDKATYYSPLQVPIISENDLECFLCRAKSTDTGTQATISTTEISSTTSMNAPVEAKKNNFSVVIGATVGGVLVVFAIASLIVFKLRRRSSTKMIETPPTVVGALSEINREDGTDDISVL